MAAQQESLSAFSRETGSIIPVFSDLESAYCSGACYLPHKYHCYPAPAAEMRLEGPICRPQNHRPNSGRALKRGKVGLMGALIPAQDNNAEDFASDIEPL